MIQLSSVENAGRCPRCRTFITSEQVESHHCVIPVKNENTIFLDWMGDGFTDENDDYIRMAQGLNGTLYSLILCRHNPPHSTKRIFTSDEKPPPDKLPVYPTRGAMHRVGFSSCNTETLHRIIEAQQKCLHFLDRIEVQWARAYSDRFPICPESS